MRGVTGRLRRSLRQRMLTPVMLGVRSFREAVLNALAARGIWSIAGCRRAIFSSIRRTG